MESRDAAAGERPIEAALGELGMEEPRKSRDGKQTANNPFPRLTLNRAILRRLPQKHWHTGKIEPIMIKPRF